MTNLSKRDAITQRAMFIKEINSALMLIKSIFKIESVDLVTDSAGDMSLDLALKIWFEFKKYYVLIIIWWGFIRAVGFVEWKEVKRFNFQYEKLTMLDGIQKTVSPLYSYCIENDNTKSKQSSSWSRKQTNPDAATTTEDSTGSRSSGKILTNVKATDD